MAGTPIPSVGRIDRKYLEIQYSRTKGFVLRMLENPLTFVGIIIVLSFIIMAIAAPVLMEPGNRPYQMQRSDTVRAPPGTPGHPLGTMFNGGDILYGIIWGSRLTVGLSFSVVIATTIIGTVVGGIAGMVGGLVDEAIMRTVDAIMSIPDIVAVMAIVMILGIGWWNIAIGLIMVHWVAAARIMRGEVIHVKNEEFVDASRVMGESQLSVLFREILPNAIQPILVQETLAAGRVVLIAASVSFIGLAPAGIAEWGVMVSAGQSGLLAGRWWTSLIPGAALFLWAFGWNIIGDGLRDVLDPQTTET